MNTKLLAGISVIACLLATASSADDSSAALGMGGVQFTQSAAIRMAEEDLGISPKHVQIRFVFANDSGRDIDTLMAFPLPDINTAEFTNSPIGTVTNDPVDFVGFSVKADGKPVAVSVEQKAFYNGHDVTAVIRSVGLPVNVITESGYKALVALPEAKRKVLVAADLAEFDDNNNAQPHWIVQTKFYWTQHFPAGKTVVLEHGYQPVTGQSFFGGTWFRQDSDETKGEIKSWCIDPPTVTALRQKIVAKLKADAQAGGYLNAFETDYVLSTGNNWKGPIGRFHLTLDKLKPDNILTLCWGGHLKKTGPTTFEDVQENFVPKSDIRMLVLDSTPPG